MAKSVEPVIGKKKKRKLTAEQDRERFHFVRFLTKTVKELGRGCCEIIAYDVIRGTDTVSD